VLRQKGLSINRIDKTALSTVLRFLVNKDYAYNTLAQYFAALSSFCDYLQWEGLVQTNLVTPFRKRYLRQYKTRRPPERQLISIAEMATLINSILNPRDKALVTLLAKTGIRLGELIRIDLDDINWIEQSIQLKPCKKRTNLTVFFDDEAARVLKRWVTARQHYHIEEDVRALFINERGTRLKRHGVYHAVTKHAERLGLHNPRSSRLEDRFTPHCCRHWFTTHLRRNGMRREFLQELRGDSRNQAIDIYDHIDRKELKRAYLAAIPLLGLD
jgi:integrase/recombinase XerD